MFVISFNICLFIYFSVKYAIQSNDCDVFVNKQSISIYLNTATTPCDGFATVFTFDDVMPPSRSLSICGLYFWWFRRDSLHATSKLDDSPQHRNISCNAKQFNVQIQRLMFCKAIRHDATPFICTLCHSTLR